MSHKKSNGQRVGNIAYGFRLGPDGEHLEPDPQEQTVLSAIRELRAGRCTLRGIAVELNARGSELAEHAAGVMRTLDAIPGEPGGRNAANGAKPFKAAPRYRQRARTGPTGLMTTSLAQKQRRLQAEENHHENHHNERL